MKWQLLLHAIRNCGGNRFAVEGGTMKVLIATGIEQAKADAIHIATEGPIGHAVRSYCVKASRPFTTSYTTRFPEYIAARSPIPESWIYNALRRFPAAA